MSLFEEALTPFSHPLQASPDTIPNPSTAADKLLAQPSTNHKLTLHQPYSLDRP
jgi:hypothetical protein